MMDVSRFLQHIAAEYGYHGQIVHVERIPAQETTYGDLEGGMRPEVAQALRTMGIERLYCHQAAAVEAIRRGEHVVIVTSTASGKTLCYTIPVLEAMLAAPEATALYLFPTKALAQDQVRGLYRIQEVQPAFRYVAGTYDGDTPTDTRRKLREEGNLILTNPDMLHSGILPHHSRWARFFSNLRYVVVDEIHTYRGVFGSNVANVIRRLNRITAHYGVRPQFICCSATIANPLELAEKLTGKQMRLVDHDGSPRGAKQFVFWNPPHIDRSNVQRPTSNGFPSPHLPIAPAAGWSGGGVERRSPNMEARDLLVHLVADQVQTIVFVRARLQAELIFRYAQEELARLSPRLADAVRAYRGGYLPTERREIEQRLFSGDLLGVVSTNALELGIDIGSLDACIMVGYPGTIASTWQQAGRAGRGVEESVVVFIAQNSPIDQFLVRTPQYFFGQSPENAVIDPDNPYVAVAHVRSAAYELPLGEEELGTFGEYAKAMLEILADEGDVKRVHGKYYWGRSSYPSAEVSLRSMVGRTYTITAMQDGTPKTIGTIDESSAFMQVHTHAIYLHDGETYFVDRLDVENKVAYIERQGLDYYTQAIDETDLRIEGIEVEGTWRRSRTFFGDVTVTTLVVMFKKVKFQDRDSIGFENLDLPAQTLETMALAIQPPLSTLSLCRDFGRVPLEGLKGIANVIVEVIPLFSMCDTMDIGAVVDSKNTGQPTLFVYDRYPGGIGFAEKAYGMIAEIMQACQMVIAECDCEEGCPSCVGAPVPPFAQEAVGTRGTLPDKEAALVILHDLLEIEPYIPKVKRTVPDGPRGTQEWSAPMEAPPMKRLPMSVEMKIRRRLRKLKQ